MGTGELDDVLAAADEARALGEPTALSEALSLLHHTMLGPDFVDERAAIAEELVTTASANGDAVLTLMGVSCGAPSTSSCWDDQPRNVR